MSLGEKHYAAVKVVSEVFQEAGYKVQLDKPFGSPTRRHYADVVALGDQDAFIIEIKPGIKTGSSDVMAMESFLHAAQSKPVLQGKRIKGIIISPGTLDPAKSLSNEWGITIINGVTTQEIKNGLNQFLRRKY